MKSQSIAVLLTIACLSFPGAAQTTCSVDGIDLLQFPSGKDLDRLPFTTRHAFLNESSVDLTRVLVDSIDIAVGDNISKLLKGRVYKVAPMPRKPVSVYWFKLEQWTLFCYTSEQSGRIMSMKLVLTSIVRP